MVAEMILRFGFVDLTDHFCEFDFNTSEVFIHTAFSMQVADSVL